MGPGSQPLCGLGRDDAAWVARIGGYSPSTATTV